MHNCFGLHMQLETNTRLNKTSLFTMETHCFKTQEGFMLHMTFYLGRGQKEELDRPKPEERSDVTCLF